MSPHLENIDFEKLLYDLPDEFTSSAIRIKPPDEYMAMVAEIEAIDLSPTQAKEFAMNLYASDILIKLEKLGLIESIGPKYCEDDPLSEITSWYKKIKRTEDFSKWNTVAKAVDHMMDFVKKHDAVKDVYEMFNPPEGEDPIIAFSGQQQFGRDIRNNFGLWQGNTALARDCINVDPETATATFRMWSKESKMSEEEIKKPLLCGEVHPDDASAVIKDEFLKQLKVYYERLQIS